MTETPRLEFRAAKRAIPLTLLLLLIARSATAEGPDGEPLAGELYATAKRASVEILVEDHLAGSGWFAEPQGSVLTAAHLVGRPGRRIEILSPTAGRLDAKVIALDRGHDLALLEVEKREEGYPALTLAEEFPPPGEDVLLFGSSIYRHALLLSGMVARDGTTFEYYPSQHGYVELVHVAATVQAGTSGGPWLNRRGEAVGLQSGMMTAGPGSAGVAYVIPVHAVRALLKSRCTAATPTLGIAIEETWQQQREFLDRFPPRTEGLVVRILKKDGPGARAGLRQWDVIVAADGQQVRLPDEFLRIVRARQPGKDLKLTVLGPDGTGVREVTVRPGKLEAAWPSP